MLEDRNDKDSGLADPSSSEPSSEPDSKSFDSGAKSPTSDAGGRPGKGIESGQPPGGEGDRGDIPVTPPGGVPQEGPMLPQEVPTPPQETPVPPQEYPTPSELAEGSKVGAGPGGGEGNGPGSKTRKKSPKKRALSLIIEIVVMLIIAAMIAILIQSFAVKAFMIPSSSMSPTLKIGDRVLVDRVTFYFRKPRRGDIIVFRYPPREGNSMNSSNPFYWPLERIGETLHLTNRGSTPYIKRVVAVGGETVELKKGKVYINGKEVKEDYLKSNSDTSDFGPVRVPEGHVFAMGDNRTASRDSRSWGTVPIRSIIGRAFLIWWPLSRMKTI